MGDTEVLADVTNTDVAMNGDNEVFEDSKVFTQKTSITLKKSNASSSSARSGSLSGDEEKKGMKRVSRSSRTSSSSYEKKKREPARLAPSAFAKFQQADAMSSSAPAKKINIKLSRSVRDRASETDTTMSTVKQIQDSSDKCKTCGKRVYPVEKLVADKNVYHNTCFKCAECNRTLRVGTYASIDGAIYCKPHFQQLFKLKGNYDEGFGKERAVKKWSAAQGDIPPDGIPKTEAQEPAKKQRRGRDGDADESGDEREEEAPSSDKSEDNESEDEKETSTAPVTNKTATAKEKAEEKSSSPEHSEDDDDLGDDEDEKNTRTTLGTDKTATAKKKAERKSSSPEHSEEDDSEDEKKTCTTSVTSKTAAAEEKTGGKVSSAQQKASNSDAVPKESRRDSNVSMKTKFFLEKIQDSKVDVPPSTKSTSVPSEVTKESKVSSLKSRFADKYKEKDSGVPFSKKAMPTDKSKDSKESLKTAPAKENTDRKISSPQNTVPMDKAKDTKVSSSVKSTSSSLDKPKDSKVSTALKTTTAKEKTDSKPMVQENTDPTDKAKDIKVPTSVKTTPAPAKEKTEEKSSSPQNTKPSKDAKDWDSLLSQKTPSKDKDRKFSRSEKTTPSKDISDKKSSLPKKIVTPDSGVDVESPSSQKNSRKSSRSKSFSDDEEEEERKRKGSTTKPSDTPQQLLSVKERMAMYHQSAEHPSSEKIKVKSNRYQSEISSSGETRKSTSGDDRKTVATGTLADLRKRWESGDLLTYQEKESTSGTTTGDEMEDTVVKSTTHSHKAIIRQEETVVAQEIKAARSKFESFKDEDQKPRGGRRMQTSSSDHDMNGVVDNGRSSPYRDEEFEQSNYENGRRSSTGDIEVVKSTTPTADDRELVKAGTASNLKKRWESGDLQDYRERSGSSSSSSSESTPDAQEESVSVVASWSVEETKSAALKPQPTPKEVPQPERREVRKSESLKKRYEEKLEKKEAKDEEREEAPRRALNRAPSFSRTMAAKFEKGAVRSRSSSSSSSSQEQDPDAEIVRATSHHHKEKPDKVVNLGLSARLRSMFEKGDVHNIEAPARKSPVDIPRSTSTPDISKAGRRDSTSSSSSEEGEAHAVKTSFSDDEVELRKAEIKGPSAKSLRAMFETDKTEESGPTTLPKSKPKSISLFKTPPMEKCRACGKTVYAMEKIATDHDTFHKSCFKCDYCKKVLSLGTFAGIHDKLYCKPHFKQLFQAKGNYDEGFGHLQRKSKWAPKSDSPMEDTQDKQQIEVEEVKRPVPARRPRSADLEEFDDKPPVQNDEDDEEFEVRRPVPTKRQSLPKSSSESEEEEEEEKEVVTRRSRSSSSSSDGGPKGRSHSASSGEGSKRRSHSASSGEGSKGRSHSASSEERRTKRRSGSSSSMDEEERRQGELSLKVGSVEEEIKRARLYRQKLLLESSQDEEDC